MFYRKNNILKSTLLDVPGIGHGFSTRDGGVSTNEHTKSMNLSFGLGDDDGAVLENMRLFCREAGVSYDGLVGSPQFHSALVRKAGPESALEGIEKKNSFPTDAFVTDTAGMSLIVRMADCAPLLFLGEKEDGCFVVGAAHAGWRGTVNGIGAAVVSEMEKAGAAREGIKVAIGQCIHRCCFEVREDFIDEVCAARGGNFAKRHIYQGGVKAYADIVGMNEEILLDAGISEKNIDISSECTACRPELYHSHRATGGRRGTMGAVIGILPPQGKSARHED